MDFFKVITPVSYGLLVVLWSLILVFYLKRLRSSEVKNSLIAILVGILAIDAFRTLFESLFFGARYSALMGLLPLSVHDYLNQPQLVFIPKLINVLAAALVLIILIRRWMPQEKEERRRERQRVADLENAVEQHKAVEEQLRQREEMYRAFFDNHYAVMLLIDPQDDRILGANPSAQAYYQLSHEELTEIKIGELEAPPLSIIPGAAADHRGRQGKYFQARHRLGNGELRDVEVYSGIINLQGKNYRNYIVLDITDRLAAEKDHREKLKLEGVMEMAGAACHELSQPLQVIVTSLGLLRYELGDGHECSPRLDMLSASVQKTADITRKIQRITRYETVPYHHETKIIDIEKASRA